jgi:nitric oxide reductase NorQ protein
MNQTTNPSSTNPQSNDEVPYYLPLADEVEVFQAAYASRLPILLKGPTGCGKTRFVEHMSWHLDSMRSAAQPPEVPLLTVSCHEDLTCHRHGGTLLTQGRRNGVV